MLGHKGLSLYWSGYEDTQSKSEYVDTQIRSDWVSAYPAIFRGCFKVAGYLQFIRTVIWSDVICPLFSVCSADTMYAADILVGYSVGRNSRNTEWIQSQLMIQVRTDPYRNYLQFLESFLACAAWSCVTKKTSAVTGAMHFNRLSK